MTQELAVIEPNTNQLRATENIEDKIKSYLLLNISPTTKKNYLIAANQFTDWLRNVGYSVSSISIEGLKLYRDYLTGKYPKATAQLKLIVAKRLVSVAQELELRKDNPAKFVANYKNASNQETTHRALTLVEAKELLSIVRGGTDNIKGKRDYAIILLLMKTGIRRSECAALTIGDMQSDQGHNILVIQHGKGDKRRITKLSPEVKRAIEDYLIAGGRGNTDGNSPIFTTITKGDRATEKPLNGLDIQRIVNRYARMIGVPELTPHGLRATFVTLSLEAGAALEKVQVACGHSDSRTTMKYRLRKENLDNHATDYLHF